MTQRHIEIILGDHAIPHNLREAVRRTGISASFRPLVEVLRVDLAPTADAVVIVLPDDARINALVAGSVRPHGRSPPRHAPAKGRR